MTIFGAPVAPLLGEIDVCAHKFFGTEFKARQLLFEVFLDILHIFSSVEAKSESIFLFSYSYVHIFCLF